MDAGGPSSFGDMLRHYRRQAGLTQEELAERAGLSTRGISDLERGLKLRPRAETIYLVADALKLTGSERDCLTAAGRRKPSSSVEQGTSVQWALLPAPPTTLVGRDQDLAVLDELLRASSVRLLTLTGPPGTGKTRLALATANRSQPLFADGVAFVDLTTIADSALVLTSIAQTCGLGDLPRHSLEESVHRCFADKRFLLVLDNFEHVLAAAPLVAALLAACRDLTVLVTSRAPLRLRAERVVSVLPLAVPDPAAPDDLVRIAASPAVALFVDRARAADHGFILDERNASIVAEICRELEGLPLSIELAAVWVRLLSPAAIRDRLRHPLDLLANGARDLPERQRSLRGAIGWSDRLLAPHERVLFHHLSMFVGGFSLEAAEAVQQAGASTDDVLKGLATLVDQNLLRRVGTGDGEPRYAMLEGIREYALEQLSADDQANSARDRHAEYFLALAKRADRELIGPRVGDWLARLDQEYGNLRAAGTWLSERGRREDGLILASSLWWYWFGRGRFGDGRAWLDSLLDRPDAPRTKGRARALFVAGVSALLQADYEYSRLRLTESLAIAREVDDAYAAGFAHACLGRAACEQGDFLEAHRLLDAAHAGALAMDDQTLLGCVLHFRGELAQAEGDYDLAWRLWNQTLITLRRRQITLLVPSPLGDVGSLAFWRGDYRLARRVLEESLAINRTLGNQQRSIAVELRYLGHVELAEGRWEAAIARFQESLTRNRQLGYRRGIATALEGLACVAAATGDLGRAGSLVRAAATLRVSMRIPLSAVERAWLDRYLAPIPDTVDESDFSDLSIEEALAHAFEAARHFGNTPVGGAALINSG